MPGSQQMEMMVEVVLGCPLRMGVLRRPQLAAAILENPGKTLEQLWHRQTLLRSSLLAELRSESVRLCPLEERQELKLRAALLLHPLLVILQECPLKDVEVSPQQCAKLSLRIA